MKRDRGGGKVGLLKGCSPDCGLCTGQGGDVPDMFGVCWFA